MLALGTLTVSKASEIEKSQVIVYINGAKYYVHTVKAGETLYSISRLYAISVETVMADNADIDPAHLALGTRLYIRKSEIGKATDKQLHEELEEYKDNLNSVTSDGYAYYLVQAGDTVYSLCRRFSMSEETLRSLNPMPEGLKAGSIIKVPAAQTADNGQQYDFMIHIVGIFFSWKMPEELLFRTNLFRSRSCSILILY